MSDRYPILLLTIALAATGLTCKHRSGGGTTAGQVSRPDAAAETETAFEVRQPGDEAAVAFGPIALPEAAEATEIPAHWFLSIAPGADLGKDALDACALGELGGVPLTLAAIEVGFDRIAVAGTVVGELERGHAPEAGWGELIEGALQGALQTLGSANDHAARRGCRPWAAVEPLPPADFVANGRSRRAADAHLHPPLLLVVDAGIPMETVERVEQAAEAARFRVGALWVQDVDPAPFVMSSVPPAPGPVLWARTDPPASSFNLRDAERHADLGGELPSSGWGPIPPGELDANAQAVVLANPSAVAGAAIARWSEVAGIGVQCVALQTDDGAAAPPRPRGPVSRRTLRWDDAIAVIAPADVRVIGPSPAAPAQRLLTGGSCPVYTRIPPVPTPAQAEAEAKVLLRQATGQAASGPGAVRVVRDLQAIRQLHPEVADTVTADSSDKRADRRDLSLAIDGDDHLYVFLQGRGDCTRGCPHHDLLLFGTDADGVVESLGCSDDARVGYLSRHPRLEQALADLGREGFEYRPPELGRVALCLGLCEGEVFRSCLRDAAEAQEGRAKFEVAMEFDVAPEGHVIQARAADQALEGSGVERCLASALDEYAIQPFAGDEPRTVRFSWNLVKGRRIVCPGCRRGERSRPYPEVEIQELTTDAPESLDEQLVADAWRLGFCLGDAPEIEQFEVRWVHQPHGAFTGLKISGIGEAAVRSCVAKEIRSWWHPIDAETPVSATATFHALDRPHDLGCRK